MKLNIMLIIAAIYWILNGLLGLLAPVSMFGIEMNAATPTFFVMAVKFWGVASLALGVIAWLVRNAEPSKTRDAVVLGSIFYFALEAPVSFYGYFIDPGSPHVPFAIIEGLIAVGLFLAYRSRVVANPA
ncbi:MAG: hypothetical protein HY782_26855 [Chloroflexi bacterium]|nr:hypothetical protein [Chloroflexota bacterium]